MEKTAVKKTAKEYGRGVIGGLLFSLPLLYTMELWWTGFIASPEKLLVFIAFTFILLLGYNRFAGVREDATFLEICKESVEELLLAFLTTFIFLLLINRVGFTMSFDEIIGKVIVESMVVAIGISVGTAQLGQQEDKESGSKEEEKEQVKGNLLQMMVLSLCGAVLISTSVAPTEEILQLAVESTNIHLLLMVVVSLFLSFVILFFSDFKSSGNVEGGFRKVFLHLMIGYLAALVISFALLWFFGRLSENSFEIILAEVIILSIPGSIGASAGRLLIG